MNERKAGDLDAVEMMRSIRVGLSGKFKDMGHEEQRKYIQEQLVSSEDDRSEKPRKRSAG